MCRGSTIAKAAATGAKAAKRTARFTKTRTRKGENVADWSARFPVAVANRLVRTRTMLQVRDLG